MANVDMELYHNEIQKIGYAGYFESGEKVIKMSSIGLTTEILYGIAPIIENNQTVESLVIELHEDDNLFKLGEIGFLYFIRNLKTTKL
jgi:hypothetical protein